MGSGAFILAIDLGTSGPKVALVGSRGELVAHASRSVKTIRIAPDGAEQDPEELWSAVVEASRQVMRESGKPRDAVTAVACVSQYSSVVPVDRDGEPTMNLILWMDGRGGPHALSLYGREPEALPTFLDVHGAAPMPSGADSLSHMLFVQHERPDVYERTHRFLEAMDFLNLRLTGEFTANACTVFMMLLTDNRNIDAVSYHPSLVAMSGISRDKLPELRPLASVVGQVLPAVADELGVARGARVLSAMNDTQAAAIAAGTADGVSGGINVGTTSQVLAHVNRKHTDLEMGVLSMPSAIPGRYTALAENGLAGGALAHFVQQLVFARDELADHSHADPFSRVDAAVASVEPGSGGVLFLPWLAGAVSPVSEPAMRGGFVNVSLSTTRLHLLRAVMEGITFNLRWMLSSVERFCDRRFDVLRYSGGGAMSDQWSQIAADAFGRPIRQLGNARFANNLAAAFHGFSALGLAGEDDFATFCPVKREYAPRKEVTSRYDAAYQQFLAAFEAVRPISSALNS